jgi:predicted metal-dependent hydrolase
MRSAPKRAPERFFVQACGRSVPVAVSRNPRARRLILRIDAGSGLPVLTLPARTPLAQGERFLKAHKAWLEEQLVRLTPAVPFQAGTTFPLRGVPCRIRHRPGRGVVTLERRGERYVLTVPGEEEFLARRVTDWLKREARRDIERAVGKHAEVIGKAPRAIRIGDAKSRWGSCSTRRVLTFTWRLIFAPRFVLDYLAAHEVAHLAQMNHGPKFWSLVAELDPDHHKASTWLATYGAELGAIGRTIEEF